MIGLIQRVTQASVTIDGKLTTSINSGLLTLVGIEKNDSKKHAEDLLKKIINYRIFADDQDKMNLSISDVDGSLLLVPQFTLAADTEKGLRPSFSNAASPDNAKHLFNHLIEYAKEQYSLVETGVFGADMKVNLINDGPVTFLLRT